MENKESQDFNFESTDLITYIHIRRKILLIFSIAALIISTVISFIIDERYESEVILFPASSSSISQSLLTENNTKKELLKFGEEEEVEQLLQVLYSDKIRNRIIDKYNLMEHYDITSSSYPRTKLLEQYEDNISFTKTEFMSVRIRVLDTKAEIAASIANNIADLVDSTMNTIQKERSLKALNIVEEEFQSQKKFIKTLEDSLHTIRLKGVMDYESQAEVLNEAYAKALAEGKTSGAKAIEEKLKIVAEYGGVYVSLREQLVHEIKKLSIIESKYQEAKVDYEQDLPYKFVVSRAEKAEQKTYPIRWLIITISTISTFLFILILFILFDSIKKKKT